MTNNIAMSTKPDSAPEKLTATKLSLLVWVAVVRIACPIIGSCLVVGCDATSSTQSNCGRPFPTAAAIPAAPSPARMGAGIVGYLCYWWVAPIVDVARDSTVGTIE